MRRITPKRSRCIHDATTSSHRKNASASGPSHVSAVSRGGSELPRHERGTRVSHLLACSGLSGSKARQYMCHLRACVRCDHAGTISLPARTRAQSARSSSASVTQRHCRTPLLAKSIMILPLPANSLALPESVTRNRPSENVNVSECKTSGSPFPSDGEPTLCKGESICDSFPDVIGKTV